MNKSLNRLHGIGFVTTATVALALFALSALAIHFWLEDRARRVLTMEETRTHAGPIATPAVRYRPDEIELLGTLPPITGLKGDGLRFGAMPSLDGPWFAYALTALPHASRAQGILKVYPRNPRTKGLGPKQVIRFTMPAASARSLFSRVGHLTEGWPGDDGDCVDGARVAFELARGGKVTSGAGNAACSEHYGDLSLLALRSAQGVIPRELRPIGKSWRMDSSE